MLSVVDVPPNVPQPSVKEGTGPVVEVGLGTRALIEDMSQRRIVFDNTSMTVDLGPAKFVEMPASSTVFCVSIVKMDLLSYILRKNIDMSK